MIIKDNLTQDIPPFCLLTKIENNFLFQANSIEMYKKTKKHTIEKNDDHEKFYHSNY